MHKIAAGLTKPRGEKRLATFNERIGRLKETCRGVGQPYAIALVPDASGQEAIALSFAKQPIEGSRGTHPGVYCLRRNDPTWDAEKLWRTFPMLTALEAVFRSLQAALGLRPVLHHQANRVDGHLFLSIWAYQFVQLSRRRWQERGICACWSTVREMRGSQCRITATCRRADGRTLPVCKATRAEPDALAIYPALNLNPAPGGIVKMIV